MAAGYLLDTNVLSETRKARADAGVISFLSAVDTTRLFVSVLTIGELRKSVAARYKSDRAFAEKLGAWVEAIETDFADRILPVDVATARRWGELSAGGSLPVIDTLIAATAIRHGLTLVTRNTRDAKTTGVPLLNPWAAR